MTKIAVIDYGMGNLHSVGKALERVCSKEQILVTSNPEAIKTADKIVLPGVGAIKDCLDAFSDELRSVTLDLIKNKPTLAICVGMQMLLESSEENGGVKCLSILDGKIVKIPTLEGIKVPHMGWNKVNFLVEHPLWKNIPNASFFYFVHSYCCLSSSEAVSETSHGTNFISAIGKENIFSVQFHPEKSQKFGLQLYKNFLEWSI
tara:strand:+ start:306 stop:917 length:612 start_codon:yes stop_codon:yes gene_type:complete